MGWGSYLFSDKWSQLIDIKRRLLIAWLHPIAPRVIIGWSAVIKEKVLELTPQVDLLLLPKKKKIIYDWVQCDIRVNDVISTSSSVTVVSAWRHRTSFR